MSRRTIVLQPHGRDGTSQRARRLPALDPRSVAIDERGHADVLEFLRAFATQLRFFNVQDGELREAGDWRPFLDHPDVTVADIVAHMQDPRRFQGEMARWLGRPHFALLLTFLELLGHAREHVNGLGARHLDHYYREVLQMLPERPAPDRVAVVFRLAARATAVRVPAGTELQAGRDASGLPRIYRTERELLLTRARVDGLRSVHVDRRIIGIPNVRKDPRVTTASEVLAGMLSLALGEPRPGDPVPAFRGVAVDLPFLVGLRTSLADTRGELGLEYHELRALLQLTRRRAASDFEWAEIARLLGVHSPPAPRDFPAIVTQAVGELDFAAGDHLPQVHTIDDLYDLRGEPEVQQFIREKFAPIDADPQRREQKFATVMAIKRRIDGEWAEVHRLLTRLGQRRRSDPAWTFDSSDPADLASDLAAASGGGLTLVALELVEDRVRGLEAHLALSIEQIQRLAALAARVDRRDDPEWAEVDRLLAGAHREKHHAADRQRLAAVRDGEDLAAFETVVRFALGSPQGSLSWSEAKPALAPYLNRGQLDLLASFHDRFVDPAAPRAVGWDDVYSVLELVHRHVVGRPEPVAVRVEWHNLHASDDATTTLATPSSSRWKTFGRRPTFDPTRPPAATLGWALRSPLLALQQGTRTVTVTFGLRALDMPGFLRGLGLDPQHSDETLRAAFAAALRLEVTTAKGWVELDLGAVRLVAGGPGADYWTLLGVPRALEEDRPALALELRAPPTFDAFSPPKDSADPWPTLRVTLRQRATIADEWVTQFGPFEGLVLAAVHLRVAVAGLVDLQLQHEDRPLDPRRPFEPFGAGPAVGAHLYLGHPELLRARLDELRLDIEWMGLPPDLTAYHVHYLPEVTGPEHFRARLDLIDRNLALPVVDSPLFHDTEGLTASTHTIAIPDVAVAIHASKPGFVYERRPELASTGDLRDAGR